MKRLHFTVTNDLSYDQRMIRICSSLSEAGYGVTLIGRKLPDSKPLEIRPFQQKRIRCFFKKGKGFYAEYNIRLFFYLLFKKTDLLCAIDLDTILAIYFASAIKRVKRVYDAHELFCEMKEVVTRPKIYRLWKRIERFTVPKFQQGYTVSSPIADEFRKMYEVQYAVIRNLPLSAPLTIPEKKEKFILYQGAVNEGRSFETLIPAMQQINARLIIAGDGNFMTQAKELVEQNKLTEKVIFTGKLSPSELYQQTLAAWIGITLFENNGLSNYFSLANRFSDYINAGIPQICVDYPVYRELNKNSPIAVLITDLGPVNISKHINELLENPVLYSKLQQNCLQVRQELNWQQEEKKLLSFYHSIFNV
ncbi:MAG: glycosyltransferase [Bacteroidota bacterium]|nr:glycosyltransferase [Bacteroidota bacterium]